jgi:hypothetical protein
MHLAHRSRNNGPAFSNPHVREVGIPLIEKCTRMNATCARHHLHTLSAADLVLTSRKLPLMSERLLMRLVCLLVVEMGEFTIIEPDGAPLCR